MDISEKRQMGLKAREEVVKNYSIKDTAENLVDNYILALK